MAKHDPDGNKPRLLEGVNLACEILQALKEAEQAGVTELAEELNLSKGAVYNHLATLREHDLVVKNGERYQLGLRFMNFGEFVKNQSVLFQESREKLDDLAERTGEYVHLMEVQQKKGMFVYRSEGENAVGDEYYSRKQEWTDPLYYSATGKATLAFLGENEIDQVISERTLEPQTEHTITDADKLRQELAQIREQGCALNDEEQFLGLRAVGAPIRDDDNQVLGAISISGPVSRISDKEFENQLPKIVIEASNVIELNIRQTLAISDE